ncbi:MAG: outer membrane homotrimeric porin [Desulfovibrio sp.]|nr:outer membrane homotrimeric porin [Desulfovibrio sp.]
MKKLCTLLLAAGILLGASGVARAVDFTGSGTWFFGFTTWEPNLVHKTREGDKVTKNLRDKFEAKQRIRLQLEAAVSEALSGTLQIQIGNNSWGKADEPQGGAALGADGKIIKVRRAFIDWTPPDFDLKVRMGIIPVSLPNKAGGTAIMETQVGGVQAAYQFNDNVGLTAMWMRPFNDNFEGGAEGRQANYLDNMDLFGLILPLTFDGFEVTPWVMYGMKGKNTLFPDKEAELTTYGDDGNMPYTLYPSPGINNFLGTYRDGSTGKAYGSVFWAGLPFQITAFDPLNIEVDLNYGYIEAMGRYDAIKYDGGRALTKRSSTQRQGWLAKALVEYKMDWGVPGVFGWYGSGDDGNPKNGSERLPTIVGYGNFTSFMGDGNTAWAWQDYDTTYSGTWGVGLQVRDVTFIEDLTHTLRVAWWGGTNSPSMVKYMESAYAWKDGVREFEGPYLTTEDGLLEVNFINNYKMYENFNINLELGYIANFMDNDTWKKAGKKDSSFEKQDAWKAQLVFAYTF